MKKDFEPIRPLVDVRKDAILAAMEKLKHDIPLVAKALGIGKTTLYRRLRDYRLAVQVNPQTGERQLVRVKGTSTRFLARTKRRDSR